uniref:Uncharacterized protein n=1 Tax=Rhizophora mucronata TaxID=61149 RepID=A0A2P2M806_RHIMU
MLGIHWFFHINIFPLGSINGVKCDN